MKDNDKDKPDENVILNQTPDVINLGDITLSSTVKDVDYLSGLLIELLKEDSIKEYLSIITKKKLGRSFVG